MAKKKSKKTIPADEPQEDTTTDVTTDPPPSAAVADEEEEMELLQVELGDMVKMKQVLDEAVIAAVTELIEEDTRWDNFKLALMTGSCFFAMIAQFAPIPFPESRPVLGICGSLYFVLSGILQFVTTYIDKDAILLTTADTEGKHKNALLKQHGLRVRTNFPRFSEYYSVILEFATPKDVSIPHFVEETWSVGNFFDKEGHFYEAGIMEETRLLFGRLDAQKYTTTDTKKKTE